MNRYLAVFLVLASCLFPLFSYAYSEIELARSHVTEELREHYLSGLRNELQALDLPGQEKSLSYIEAEQLATTLIEGYAHCIVAALLVSDGQTSNEAFEYLASKRPMKNFGRYFSYLTDDEKEDFHSKLSQPTETCYRRIETNLGLLRDDDEKFFSMPGLLDLGR